MSTIDLLLKLLDNHFISLARFHYLNRDAVWVNGKLFDTVEDHDSPEKALEEAARIVRDITMCIKHNQRRGSNGVCYQCQQEQGEKI